MNKKVEFLEYEYTEKLDLIKIKSLIESKNVVLAMTGSEFDNMICQISKKNVFFSEEQRQKLLEQLMGKSFYFEMTPEINNNISVKKEEDVKNLNNIIDNYPFYEICKDIDSKEK
ncbi:MAG: hypothetical protein WC942_12235 [Clostridia bacterium]|jgi:hypothetical protein